MNGRRNISTRTSNVGSGSSTHDLTSACLIIRRTSVCVQGLNDASDDDAVLDIGGGGSPAVADHTSRTFLSRNSAKVVENGSNWGVTNRKPVFGWLTASLAYWPHPFLSLTDGHILNRNFSKSIFDFIRFWHVTLTGRYRAVWCVTLALI